MKTRDGGREETTAKQKVKTRKHKAKMNEDWGVCCVQRCRPRFVVYLTQVVMVFSGEACLSQPSCSPSRRCWKNHFAGAVTFATPPLPRMFIEQKSTRSFLRLGILTQRACFACRHLVSPFCFGLSQQSSWCLGNIAGDCVELRDLVINAGGMDGLLLNLANPASVSIVR